MMGLVYSPGFMVDLWTVRNEAIFRSSVFKPSKIVKYAKSFQLFSHLLDEKIESLINIYIQDVLKLSKNDKIIIFLCCCFL